MPAAIAFYFVMITSFYLDTLHLARGEPTRKMPEIEANAGDGDSVTETHQASCKIATEEMVANARATFTRVLVGACEAKTMDERFASLEEKLAEEFADVKRLLRSVLLARHTYRSRNEVRDVEPHDDDDGCLSPRQDEIDRFNNTVQNSPTSDGSASAFVYYWRVTGLDEMLASWRTGRSLRSPTLHVGPHGYAVYLRLTPKYFPDGTVFVGVGLTRGRYDAALVWPFPLRLRLEILDHSPEGTREDRRSRTWDPAAICTERFWGRPGLKGRADNPECVGLSIPRRVILSASASSPQRRSARNSRYMWNGSVLIKLVVYLT